MPKDFQYHVVINRDREYILDTVLIEPSAEYK